MGGLARRVGFTQAFRKAFTNIPVLEVSVGNIFNDQGITSDPPFRDVVVQNDYAMKGYSKYPFDAANVNFNDLRVLYPNFKLGQQKKAMTDFPALKSMVAGNLMPAVDKKTQAPIQPFIIREIAAPRAPKGKLRIGITSFSEPGPGEETGYVWRDPLAAAKEILPKLRKQVDVVIVLAYLPIEQAKQLAQENQDTIDVVVAGHVQPFLLPVEKVGNVNFVVNNYETKFLGELRMYFGKDGERWFTNRFITLDDKVPDQPDAAKIAEEAKAAIETVRRGGQ
jgi:2',3'-cyclic-nucleotide 2'-phosphodiesterase (5'-nucleotidase family)